MPIDLSWITTRDIPELMRIERASYEFPWNCAELINFLRKRDCTGRVALCGREVVGFTLYRFGLRNIRIESLAVDPTWRRQGIATAMVTDLRKKLYARRPRISTLVRERNLIGQQFFRSQGFKYVYSEKGPYEDGSEDGYVLQFRIPIPALECVGK